MEVTQQDRENPQETKDVKSFVQEKEEEKDKQQKVSEETQKQTDEENKEIKLELSDQKQKSEKKNKSPKERMTIDQIKQKIEEMKGTNTSPFRKKKHTQSPDQASTKTGTLEIPIQIVQDDDDSDDSYIDADEQQELEKALQSIHDNTQDKQKTYQDCQIIEPTLLTKQNVRCKIIDTKIFSYKIGLGLIRGGQSIRFQIKTQVDDQIWQVERTQDEFKHLKTHLSQKYQYLIIPHVPSKLKNLKEPNHHKKYYQRFLDLILKSEVLKSDIMVFLFLTEENSKTLQSQYQSQNVIQNLNNVKKVITENGKAKVQITLKSGIFASLGKNFVYNFKQEHLNIRDSVEKIVSQSQNLAQLYSDFSDTFKSLNKKLCNHKVYEDNSFDILKRGILANSGYYEDLASIIDGHLNSNMMFSRDLAFAYENLWKQRFQIKQKYTDMMQEIEKKSLKLFESEEDLTKWGILDYSLIEQNKARLVSDYQYAKRFMLSKENADAEILKSLMGFITNQCYKQLMDMQQLESKFVEENIYLMTKSLVQSIYNSYRDWNFVDEDLEDAIKDKGAFSDFINKS